MTRLRLERRSLAIDGEICKEIFTGIAHDKLLPSAGRNVLEGNNQIARC